MLYCHSAERSRAPTGLWDGSLIMLCLNASSLYAHMCSVSYPAHPLHLRHSFQRGGGVSWTATSEVFRKVSGHFETGLAVQSVRVSHVAFGVRLYPCSCVTANETPTELLAAAHVCKEGMFVAFKTPSPSRDKFAVLLSRRRLGRRCGAWPTRCGLATASWSLPVWA